MPDITPDPLQELLARLREARAAAAQDPFGDPVLLIALAISRRMDDGVLDLDGLAAMVQQLSPMPPPPNGPSGSPPMSGWTAARPRPGPLAERLVRPDPEDSPIPFARYRALVETPRFAAVFTAHPTFSLPYATGTSPGPRRQRRGLARRPGAPPDRTDARRGIPPGRRRHQRGRDALDGLAGALLTAARGVWGGPLDRPGAAAGAADFLGRLRHRWPHRYRLVGHAAAAAGP